MSLVPRFGKSSISTLNGAYSGVGSSESFHAELLYAEAGIQTFGPVGQRQFAIQDATLTKHVVKKNNPVPVQETHTNMPSVECVEIVELSRLTLGTGEIEDMRHVMNSPKKRIEMFVCCIVDRFLSMGWILHSLVILTLTMGILWNFLGFSSVEGNRLLLEGVATFTKTFTKTLVTDSLIFTWNRDGVWLPPEFTDKDRNWNLIIFDDGSDCIRLVTCDDDWEKVLDD